MSLYKLKYVENNTLAAARAKNSTLVEHPRCATVTPASRDGRAALTRLPIEGEVGAEFSLLGRASNKSSGHLFQSLLQG